MSGFFVNMGLVYFDGFGDLVVDGVDRGECRYWILEYCVDCFVLKLGYCVVGKF